MKKSAYLSSLYCSSPPTSLFGLFLPLLDNLFVDYFLSLDLPCLPPILTQPILAQHESDEGGPMGNRW
jgi:hypothetical protein